MRKTIMAAIVAVMCLGFVQQAYSALYVEYYRDNLFGGLAFHRIACLTDWNTIQSNQDYDGFTHTRYCFAGATAESVPNGEWFDWNHAASKAQLDNCGAVANNAYGTPNYADRSNTCSYNIFTNCNSDCWIRRFSQCQGKQVAIASPCW